MAENGANKFPLPEASWNTLKKIARAYYAKRDSEQITVQEVADAAGLHRPQVSSTNNFLRAFGVLEQDSNKLTSLGSELALGITRDDAYTVGESLRSLIRACPPLKKIIEILEARGQLDVGALQTQALLALNLDPKDRRAPWTATLFDILEEAGVLRIEDGKVYPVLKAKEPTKISEVGVAMRTDLADTPSAVAGTQSTGLRRIPIPVAPASLWYVEVSEKPGPEEIRKFLDMQKLIFDMKD